MNDCSFLLFPSVLGLAAGILYGAASHSANLPLALTDHLLQPLLSDQYQQD
ncbi:MAG: hypothetical protein AAGF66_01925 [Cyanobacteria bacterium P01_H01_bin.119]